MNIVAPTLIPSVVLSSNWFSALCVWYQICDWVLYPLKVECSDLGDNTGIECNVELCYTDYYAECGTKVVSYFGTEFGA